MSENRIEAGCYSCPSCGSPTEVDNTDPCGCVCCGDCSRCDPNGQPGQCCSEDCCDPVEGACANTVGIWSPILYTVGATILSIGISSTDNLVRVLPEEKDFVEQLRENLNLPPSERLRSEGIVTWNNYAGGAEAYIDDFDNEYEEIRDQSILMAATLLPIGAIALTPNAIIACARA